MVAEEIVPRFSCILERARAVRHLQHFTPVKHAQNVRQISITHVRQFIQGKLPVCFPRTSTYESQFAVVWSARIKFQKIVDLGRPAVFINTEEADIQIVTGIFEIIRVTAEKRHLLFRREDQPYIIVTFVTIKMIRAALI